ncbi:M1 family metallopeptidase [Luteibacter aegosomatis]|uniref:M1 family metallopeptidase n=1 Tax=Luteibacter aegosomatis TaxID=2911537 RepID=UPI001FF7A2AA|nr:M1 family metallopeptidase [Luteibacter aegosomatis]UPG85029.1 M1 family metallopeptidase [Luteibacter aegosomatis]
MHRLVRPLLLTALAAACGTALAAGTDAPPLGHLPGWAQPESYKLSFKVDPKQETYSGSTTVKVKLTQASDFIWLHGKDLKVSKVVVTDAAGKKHEGKYTVAAEKEGVARVDLGAKLDGEITLAIDFTAPLNKQLQGLYKVSHEGVPYAMTQMEPVSARYAFPGFDEPIFKTPYDISLTIPADDQGVANTAQIKEEKAGAGWKTLTFSTTKPLPTYLVAFAVGPWDVVKGPDITPTQYRSTATPLRGIAAKGEGHRMQHVLGETNSIIHTLEDYYGFGYPFDKLDLLAAPDFSAGAMENAGLVTFRDWLLLIDPDSAAQYVRGSFNVNAHELAHQWTGDTVTMAWWNDLWLNEAFATWMQQKVTQKVHPEYRADLDRVRGAQGAMGNDSLVSARKIRQEITGNGDIETAFDGITYQKGAAVLGMFEGYVSEPTFQKGMRAYIQKHKFANATADDLVDSIAEAAGQGEQFKKAFNSFLDQSGVPYVTTQVKTEGGKTVLELKQSRYLPLGSTGDANRVWGVPMCVRYGTGGGANKVKCEIFDKATGSMVLDGAAKDTWVMPNADGRGYYRFAQGKADLAALSKVAGTLTDAEQLAYADAVRAGFQHGDLDAGDVLAAYKPLTASKVREVFTAPMATLEWILSNEATNDAQRNVVRKWATDAYLPKLKALGYRKKAGEPDNDTITRTTLASFLAGDMDNAEVRAELLKQGDAALKAKDGRLDLDAADPDLLGASLGVAVQERGAPAVDALIAEIPKTSDPAKRNAMLSALSEAKDPALANKARDFALGKDVKVGEMAMVLSGGRHSEASRNDLWKWFVANYDKIVARTGSFAGGRLPALGAGGSCSKAEADRLSAFFDKDRLSKVSGAERGLAQTSESILLCSALKAKQDPKTIR